MESRNRLRFTLPKILSLFSPSSPIDEGTVKLRSKLEFLLECYQGQRTADFGQLFRLIQQILSAPTQIPAFRIVVFCMRGELRRSVEQYKKAELDYREAIRQAEGLDFWERIENEWIRHWYPRAVLGLFTILRRQLSFAPHKIREYLNRGNIAFEEYAIPDMEIQYLVAESVLRRQMGDIETAILNLDSAIAAISEIKVPYYLYWWPCHFDSHRILACLVHEEYRGLAEVHAHALYLRGDADFWSRTVALIALIHLGIEDILLELIQPPTLVPNYLAELQASSYDSGDPTLITESLVLHAVYFGCCGDFVACHTHLIALFEELNRALCHPLIYLLRAVEIATLLITWDHTVFNLFPREKLLTQGKAYLDQFCGKLVLFGLSESSIETLNSYLSLSTVRYPDSDPLWLSPVLQELRARVWP